MSPEEQEVVFNKDVPEGAYIVAHCVPTRAFRVIAMPGERTFRVEQLTTASWTWLPLSTHSGDAVFESFVPALNDMIDKQETFKDRIVRARIDHKNAIALAEKEHGTSSNTRH